MPEQFSAPYLERYVESARSGAPVIVLGDSSLWGYHLAESDSAVGRLIKLRPRTDFLNLSYEGGSTVNSLFALRLALARGVRPDAVVLNLNSKEFNAEDSAYRRLQPSLERAVSGILTPRDRALLATLPAPSFADRLDALVARVWALYRYRVDIRVALFGFDDFSGLVTDRIQRLTGEHSRYEKMHAPTPDDFLGTYDLNPIGPQNVELVYLRELRDELVRRRIPTLAFLTPTNHDLLGTMIDNDAYAANLSRITNAIEGPSIRVVNLDRLKVGPHFVDNDHLDAVGSQELAQRLALELTEMHR